MSKTVLVTGASKGIGRAIIIELAKQGYNVVINYNNSEKEALELKDLVESKYNAKALSIKCDISNEFLVMDMFNEIEKTFGGVDVLVNNAAIDLSNLFSKIEIEDFRKTLDVNVVGAFICSRLAFPYMKKNKWGRIINISSTNGINTYFPSSLVYDLSKAALNSLTHDLAVEFKPYVLVNAIAPGFIGTDSELKDYDEDFLKSEEEKILIKRCGTPEEVAHLVKFLASDEASYINNSIIRIDGGQLNS